MIWAEVVAVHVSLSFHLSRCPLVFSVAIYLFFLPPTPPPSQLVEMQMSVWIIGIWMIRIQRLRLRRLQLLCFLLLTGFLAGCVRIVMKVCLSRCWNGVFFFVCFEGPLRMLVWFWERVSGLTVSPALWIRSDGRRVELQRRPSELHPKLLIRVNADVSL